MKTGVRAAARWVGAVAFLAAFAAEAQFPSSQVVASSFQSSGASSNASSAASGASNASSRASQSDQSTQSSSDSTGAGASTGVDRAASTWIIAGSAGLLTTAGAIALTVYTLNAQRGARLRTETFRKSAPPTLSPPVEATQPPSAPPPPLTPAPATPTPPPLPEPGSTSVSPPGAEPSFASMAQARAWLLANRLQLQQDLALGAGPAIDDLAGIAGIAPARRPHFGRVLARLRHRLLVAPGVSPVEASQALAAVGDAVLADPVLRPDAEALLASW